MVGNDPNAILLAHFDGTNGSTTITDSSASAHTGSATGSGAISTAISEFGGASFKCVGAGAAGSSTGFAKFVQAASEFTFASDFTVECWVYFIALGAQSSPSDMVWSNRNNSSSDLALFLDGSGNWAVGNSAGTIIITTSTKPVISTQYHVAVVRSGSTITLYVGGISIGSASNASSFTGGDFVFGGTQVNGSTRFTNGYIDEARVSNIARWTANFTPPTSAYTKGIIPNTGSYAVAGVTINLKRALHIILVTGTYAVTGVAAVLAKARFIFPATGAYAVTGLSLVVSEFIAPARKLKLRVSQFVLQKLRNTPPTLQD